MSDTPPVDTLPIKLRWIADWLDFSDRQMSKVVEIAAASNDFQPDFIAYAMRVLHTGDLQVEIRHWADLLDDGVMDPLVPELQASIDQLQGRIAVMVGDDPNVVLRNAGPQPDGFHLNLGIPHWAANMLAYSFMESLTESGAKNFLEVTLRTPDGQPLLVSIQAPQGRTPGSLLHEANQEITKLKKLCAESAAALDEVVNDGAVHSYPVGAHVDDLSRRLKAVSDG